MGPPFGRNFHEISIQNTIIFIQENTFIYFETITDNGFSMAS